MGFGKRLKQARNERGLTGPLLAAKLGLERSMIPQYETERTAPSMAVLQKMAQALQVSLDWLVLGEATDANELYDKELATYFKKVDRLESRERSLIKMFLDSMLARQELEELKIATRKRPEAA